jgi:hypothetical protein
MLTLRLVISTRDTPALQGKVMVRPALLSLVSMWLQQHGAAHNRAQPALQYNGARLAFSYCLLAMQNSCMMN